MSACCLVVARFSIVWIRFTHLVWIGVGATPVVGASEVSCGSIDVASSSDRCSLVDAHKAEHGPALTPQEWETEDGASFLQSTPVSIEGQTEPIAINPLQGAWLRPDSPLLVAVDGISLLMTTSNSSQGVAITSKALVEDRIVILMVVCGVLVVLVVGLVIYGAVESDGPRHPLRAVRPAFKDLARSQKTPLVENTSRDVGRLGSPRTMKTYSRDSGPSSRPSHTQNGDALTPAATALPGTDSVPSASPSSPAPTTPPKQERTVRSPPSLALVADLGVAQERHTTIPIPIDGRPPPLCPALVLNFLTKLYIIASNLNDARREPGGAQLNVDGPLRQSLFRADIAEVSGHLTLGVCIPSQGPRPWAKVRPLIPPKPALEGLCSHLSGGVFKLFELLDQNGDAYGVIASESGGTQHLLIHRSSAALSIIFRRESMELSAVPTQAAPNADQVCMQLGPMAANPGTMELKVSPGYDPLLLVTTALAIAVFS